MATEPETREEPDRGHMPVITMIGAALFLFLFVGLVGVMFYLNKQFHKAPDETAERRKQLEQLRQADEAALKSYGKGDKGLYRIPIEDGMRLIANESKGRKEDGK